MLFRCFSFRSGMRHLHRWTLQGVFRRRYVRFRAVLFRRVVFFVTFFAVRFVLRVPPPTAFFTALTTVSSGLGVFLRAGTSIPPARSCLPVGQSTCRDQDCRREGRPRSRSSWRRVFSKPTDGADVPGSRYTPLSVA